MKKYRIPTIVFIMAFFCCGAVFADDGVYGDPTPGIIDHGLLGVADLSFAGGDLTAEPTDAGWVNNILQITTWEDEDRVQCWGAYPWDTTGEWIVYTSERYPDEKDIYYYGSNEIVKVKADGSGFMQLTTNDSCDSHASFVPPANDKIVFQRNDSGYAEIWMKDADDPTPASEVNLTLLHGGPVPDQWTCNNKPVVSHDGTRIAFHTDDQDIWVMEPIIERFQETSATVRSIAGATTTPGFFLQVTMAKVPGYSEARPTAPASLNFPMKTPK